MIDLGDACDRSILKAAGLDPDKVQPGSLTIDMVPTVGPATIRYTMVTTIDSAVLRQLIAVAVAPGAVSTSSTSSSVSATVKL